MAFGHTFGNLLLLCGVHLAHISLLIIFSILLIWVGLLVLLPPILLLSIFLFSIGISAKSDLLLLVPVQIFILIKRMLPQIAHIDVDFGLVRAHVVIYFSNEQIQGRQEVRVLLSNLRLVRSELVLHVAYKLLEVALVVENELADHGLVDFD